MVRVSWFVSTTQSTTSTFQAVLITNGMDSYAVFIYECGGMEWGGAEIGWQARRLYGNNNVQEAHYLSGSVESADIGCLYSSNHSAIVYRLYRGLSTVKFHGRVILLHRAFACLVYVYILTRNAHAHILPRACQPMRKQSN